MDLEQLLRRLAEEGAAALSDEELAFIRTELAGRAEGIDVESASDDDLAWLQTARQAAEAVRNEEQARQTAATERTNAAREAAAALADLLGTSQASEGEGEPNETPDEGGGDGDEGEGEGTEVPQAPSEEPAARPPQETEDNPSGIGEPRSEEEPALAASGRTSPGRPDFGAILRHRPRRAEPEPARTSGTVITASANVPGVGAGQILDHEALDRVFVEQWNAAQRMPEADDIEHAVRLPVARVQTAFPEDRQLSSSDALLNQERLEAVTAAGGPCAPVEVDYSVAVIGTAERPLRASLPQFQASRGGVRFMQPPRLGDYAAGVSAWTQTVDASAGALDGTVTKPRVRITCGDEVVERTEAIPVRAVIGNWIARSYPERVAAFRELLSIEAARFTEARHLAKMGAGSTQLTSSRLLGAARDALTTIDIAQAVARDRFRMSDNAPLDFWANRVLRTIMRVDLVRELPGSSVDRMATADAEIDRFFAARNIRVNWLLDDEDGPVFAAQGAGALQRLPNTVDFYMSPAGSWKHLDDGVLDLSVTGPYRDSRLNDTNDAEIMMETFENVYFQGTWSWRIRATLCATGASAGTVDIDPAVLCA